MNLRNVKPKMGARKQSIEIANYPLYDDAEVYGKEFEELLKVEPQSVDNDIASEAEEVQARIEEGVHRLRQQAACLNFLRNTGEINNQQSKLFLLFPIEQYCYYARPIIKSFYELPIVDFRFYMPVFVEPSLDPFWHDYYWVKYLDRIKPKVEGEPILVPKPTKPLCIVCGKRFRDYASHIKSNPHKSKQRGKS